MVAGPGRAFRLNGIDGPLRLFHILRRADAVPERILR